MNLPLRRRLEEVEVLCGISQEVIIRYIREEWVRPIDRDHYLLDEEDVARVRLIRDLIEDFGVNENAVPIILHLIDQLNLFHLEKSKS